MSHGPGQVGDGPEQLGPVPAVQRLLRRPVRRWQSAATTQPQRQVQNNYNYNSTGTRSRIECRRGPPQPDAATRRGPARTRRPAASITTTRPCRPLRLLPPRGRGVRPRATTTPSNMTMLRAQRPCAESAVAKHFGGRRRGTIVHGPRGACRLAAARAAEGLPPVAVRRHGPDNTVRGQSSDCRRACGTGDEPASPKHRRLPSSTSDRRQHRRPEALPSPPSSLPSRNVWRLPRPANDAGRKSRAF